jgi:tRNA (cytidine/uridine-2'-O-)-methyltransferase
MSLDLVPHHLKIALVRPQIAPNTGNIARLCVATGTELHLSRPLGFVLSDKELKRSAMDYWPRLKLTVHDDDATLFGSIGSDRAWMLSSKGEVSLFDADFRDGDWLVFGNETHGLPETLLERDSEHVVRIPQASGERCLNLSTAVGIALFQALSKIQKKT